MYVKLKDIALLLALTVATGHVQAQNFSVKKLPNGRWALHSPQGQPFWSLGVTCVDQGAPWLTYDPKNPSYRAWTLFPNAATWASETKKQLRGWGFNTLGGWSDYATFNKLPAKERLPYTVVLHLGAYYRAPWEDLFSPQALAAIDRAAKDQITPIKGDPFLIGYFTDNELGWWDDTVFLNYVKLLPAKSPGRIRAHKMLRELYNGSFTAFKKDWITKQNRWQTFAKNPDLSLRPGGNGMKAVNAWMRVIGEHYYETVHDAVRKYDTKSLILGDRYLQYYNFELARSSRKWVDVASTNMGSHWTDGTFSLFFLETLHKITGKPILITEFYMAATENRSGNKNDSANFPVVQTQAERARSFKRNVEELGRVPFVLGAHWFQMHDEPMFGRADGENYNMGLIDIYGQPYEEITQAAKSINHQGFLSEIATKRGRGLVPSVSFDPMAAPSLKEWPRSEGLVNLQSAEAFADIYVCQKEDGLHIGIRATSYIDESLYLDKKLPESERPRWRLTLGDRALFDIRFSGRSKDKKPLPAKDRLNKVNLIEKPDLNHTIIVKVPWSELGGKPEGSVRLQSTLESHSRGEKTTWVDTLRF